MSKVFQKITFTITVLIFILSSHLSLAKVAGPGSKNAKAESSRSTNEKKRPASVDTSDLYSEWRKGCYQNTAIQGKNKQAMTAICNCIERQMRTDKIGSNELQVLVWYYTNSPKSADEEHKPENEPVFEYDNNVTSACIENPNR